MKFWEFFALLFMAWRGQYYYVKSGGKQYTLVVMSFTAANFCQDNPNRNVLENKHIQILTLTHSQAQMYMMPNRKNYPPPLVVKLDRHLQILLDKLDGKLLPDEETRVVASGMTTYFQQRAKMKDRDGNEDPSTEAWKVFHEDETKLTPEQRALLEDAHSYKTAMAWKDVKLHEFDLSKVSKESRAVLDKSKYYQIKEAFTELDTKGGVLSNVSKESRAVLEESSVYKSMDTALTEHLKAIEQMKEDRSNYVLVGTENVFYIPASKVAMYSYVWTLRHLAKDNWKRLKFEQAAGISLFKMEKAYSQLSMAKQPCATSKRIDKRLEQEKMIQALAEKNRQAAMKKRGMQQRQQMEQPRLSAHQQMEQLERVAISVVRPSKEVEFGIGLGKRGDRMTVTSIAPGIFDGSQLKVGMIIDSVNGSCPLSFKDALHTLQNAEGRINIVALSIE